MLPTLVSARLRLVPFGTDDIPVLHALWTDADVRRHSGNARSFGVMERLGMTQVPGGVASVPGVVYYVAIRPTDLRG